MKIALVCDWLTNIGGAERVLKSIHELYPSAPIYTSQYDPQGIDWFKNADVRTSWLQIFPVKLRRFLGPLRQLYFSHLNLRDYDLVISVTGAEAKSVKAKRHLCYCHVPTQYYWQFYDQYIENPGFGLLDPLARLGLKILVKPLRKADYKAAQRVDEFITISSYAADQIKTYYDREAHIIHPPVDLEKFHTPVENSTTKKGKVKSKKPEQPEQRKGFVNISRQVTWKRLDVIVKACHAMNLPLTLIGDGPEHDNLLKLAEGDKNITFLPAMPQDQLVSYLHHAEAFLFPSCEPFGIAPVEALAAGCPVIAFQDGGARDYVKDGKNGLFFPKQTPNSLMDVLKKFEHLRFNSLTVSKSVENFSDGRFKDELEQCVGEWMNHD